MIAAALSTVSIICFFIPHLTSFPLLCAMMVFKGVTMGMLDTGANLMTIWLHGENCDPYIQSLHSSFAIGAVIGPAFIKGLLSAGRPLNAAWYFFGSACIPIIAALLYFKSPSEHEIGDKDTHQIVDMEEIGKSSRFDGAERQEKDIEMTNQNLDSRNASHSNQSHNHDDLVESTPKTSLPPSQPIFHWTWATRYVADYKPYLAVLGVALFLGCYIGGEVATGAFLTTFALRTGLSTEDGGAMLTTLFWLAFAIGRVIAIPTSVFVSPKNIMAINLVGALVSSGFVWMTAKHLYPFGIATLAYGFFLAPIFPSAITLLQTIIPVTGGTTTVMVVGASLGEMIVPLMVSSTFETTKYMSLIYVQFSSVASGALVMAGVAFLGYRIVRQRKAITPIVPIQSSKIDEMVALEQDKAQGDEPVHLDL